MTKFKCKVVGCAHYSAKGNKRFPTDPEIIRLWLAALNLDFFKPGWRICLDHFSDKDFDYIKKSDGTMERRLKPNAVPSVFKNLQNKVSAALKNGAFLFHVVYDRTKQT